MTLEPNVLRPVTARLPPRVDAASVTLNWLPVPSVTMELRFDTPETVKAELSAADEPEKAPVILTVDANAADPLVLSVDKFDNPEALTVVEVKPPLNAADDVLTVNGPVDVRPPLPMLVRYVLLTVTGALNVLAAFTVTPCRTVAPEAVSDVTFVAPVTASVDAAETGPVNVLVDAATRGPFAVSVFSAATDTLSAKFDVPATDN